MNITPIRAKLTERRVDLKNGSTLVVGLLPTGATLRLFGEPRKRARYLTWSALAKLFDERGVAVAFISSESKGSP